MNLERQASGFQTVILRKKQMAPPPFHLPDFGPWLHNCINNSGDISPNLRFSGTLFPPLSPARIGPASYTHLPVFARRKAEQRRKAAGISNQTSASSKGNGQ